MAVRENQARASASSGLQARRFQPVSVRPIAASSPNQDTNRSRETSGMKMGGYADGRRHARIPGFANAHSHAFQRALRGRVERVDPEHPHDDFWTWREAMYEAANAVDPDGGYEVALPLYGEMVAAGYTVVGRVPLPAPPARRRAVPGPQRDGQGHALPRQRDAGIEIVLLMCAYARAGAGQPPAERAAAVLRPKRRGVPVAGRGAGSRVPRRTGAAQRAGAAPRLAGGDRRATRSPAAWWCTSTPTSSGARSRSAWPSTACGRSSCWPTSACCPTAPRSCMPRTSPTTSSTCWPPAASTVCACPTTEANLGDGFLPARRLLDAGDPGVHRHATRTRSIDPILELREIEACARRQAEQRNVLVPAGADGPTGYLLEIGTVNGARALGLDGPVGEVEVDLDIPPLRGVERRTSSPRWSSAALRPRSARSDRKGSPMDFTLSPELLQLRARTRALVDDVLQPAGARGGEQRRPAQRRRRTPGSSRACSTPA